MNKLLKEKIRFEDVEQTYSKYFYNDHYLNYGYCIYNGKFYFYYLNYWNDYINDYYILLRDEEFFDIPSLLCVKELYNVKLKQINKFKLLISLTYKRKNGFGYYK